MGGTSFSRRLLAFAVPLALGVPLPAFAARTTLANQGYAVDRLGNPLDGNQTIVYRLYTSETGATPLWSETQVVAFESGVYAAVLGATTALPDDLMEQGEALYLGMQIGDDAELTPRLEYTAMPWSKLAERADVADVAESLAGSAAATSAGAGIAATDGVFSIGAGTGITVTDDGVAINTGAALTWTGSHSYSAQMAITAVPASTASSAASLYLNPASVLANAKIFDVANNSADLFTVDAEGDVVIAGSVTIGGTLNGSAVGDITSVTAGAGLTGGATNGDATLTIGAGNAITVNADDIGVATNSINEDELAQTISLANLDFFDLALITHGTTALQGFRLPQVGAAPSSPASGEGFVGWDQTANQMKVYDGSTWTDVGIGDITGVTAGSGLTGGGTSGAPTLNVGAGTGITVNDDDIAIDTSVVPRLGASNTFSSGNIFSNTVGVAGQLSATRDPSDTTAANASVYINPATSAANEKYLALADNGTAVFSVDKEGDVSATGTITATFSGNVTGNVTGDVTGNVTGAVTGNASTATALAANGANCSAGNYALGVDASGVAETCTADDDTPDSDGEVPDAITVTTSTQLTATRDPSDTTAANASVYINPATSAANEKYLALANNGTAVFSVDKEGDVAATSVTLSGGVLTGNVTGDVTGNVTGAVTGNASTATALAANGANCSAGNYALGVDASGVAETCTADDDTPDSDGEVPNDITIAASDGKLIDLSAINASSTTEGLKLPQATDVSAATAEGQLSWDTDNDMLYVGNGASVTQIGVGDITGITAGSGLSGTTASGDATLALGPLTADWSQTGAFDLVLNNASSELKILESAGATYYGIFDVTDLSGDRTYTFPNVSGTMAMVDVTQSFTGQQVFTKNPGNTAIGAATLLVNPSADLNDIMIGVEANGTNLFYIDYEGDTGWTDDAHIGFGNINSTTSTAIEYDTTQTNDALVIGVDDADSTSRALILADQADMSFNFAHGVQTNPTLFVHSASQSTTQWASLAHNQTDAVISTGTGDISMTPAGGDVSITGSLAISVASIDSAEITDETITADDLNAALTFTDSEFVNLSAINASSTTEGLKLPQATNVSASTAEGQITWDTDNDILYVGDGAAALAINGFSTAIETGEITNGTIINEDVSNSAAIAYSKLNLATSIVNADVSGSAAIAYSKLNLASSILSTDLSLAMAPSWTGAHTFNTDVTLTYAGGEDFAISNTTATTSVATIAMTLADTNTAAALYIAPVDNTTTSGEAYGILVDVGNGTASAEAGIGVNHTDTGQALVQGVMVNADDGATITTGLAFTGFGFGGSPVDNGIITTAIDASEADIGTALNVGANPIVGSALTLQSSGTSNTTTIYMKDNDSSVFSVKEAGTTYFSINTTNSQEMVSVSDSVAFKIPQGTGPSLGTAGNIGVDTTDDQLKYYGAAVRVIPYRQTKSLVLESPSDSDRLLLWRPGEAVTVTQINCIADPADSDSVVIALYESDSSGDFTDLATNGLDGATTITCDNDGAADDGTLSNGTIASNAWLGLDVGTVTGTVSTLTITVRYTTDAQ